MLVNQFNGGENSRPAPQMLQQNEGVVYVNIDESKGTLCSVKDKLLTNIETAQFSRFYSAGNRFISFPIFTSFAEYNNDLIYCNAAGARRSLHRRADRGSLRRHREVGWQRHGRDASRLVA